MAAIFLFHFYDGAGFMMAQDKGFQAADSNDVDRPVSQKITDIPAWESNHSRVNGIIVKGGKSC
ncbi:MAG: hypothetical protein DSY90_03620 [Deltaproteobacteria bacterium]|nr:MAG: hypothetical protein DSY90_03620 [Deltaproteobacteria bacterium]